MGVMAHTDTGACLCGVEKKSWCIEVSTNSWIDVRMYRPPPKAIKTATTTTNIVTACSIQDCFVSGTVVVSVVVGTVVASGVSVGGGGIEGVVGASEDDEVGSSGAGVGVVA